MSTSEARERLLEAAERLFAEKGYAAVKLKDVAAALGIAHASLYHHVPGGKEQLFVEVMERHFLRHQHGIEAALAPHAGDLRAQLHAIAGWLLTQPPFDLQRMVQSDLPVINRVEAARLSQLALDSMIEPILVVLKQAEARGELAQVNLDLVAGGMFGMIQSMQMIPQDSAVPSRQDMARELIDIFLSGLLKK
jgi:AcrR family transcriptional regulator